MSEKSNGTGQQQKNLIRARFTQTAEVFANFAVPDRVTSAEKLARLVAAGSQDCVVDLACGPGTLALRFARHARWVCGLDMTPAMLQRAQETAAGEGLDNLVFATGDAQALPFADASLDIAVTSYSLHHMSDPARVVQEMGRVVRRGGRVGILDIRAPEHPQVAELNERIEIMRDPSHTRTLGQAEFHALLASAGLRVLATEIEEHPRDFDHWLHVAGWHRGDRRYDDARRMMIESMTADSAGFHPRYTSGAGAGDPSAGIEMVNTSLLIAGEKI
ncbi:MAG: class I SAM-dependent methyltransferase [Candidatus Acidiferrales bacterium]